MGHAAGVNAETSTVMVWKVTQWWEWPKLSVSQHSDGRDDAMAVKVAQRWWWWWLGLREWVAAQWHRGGWHVMVVAAVLDMLAEVRLA